MNVRTHSAHLALVTYRHPETGSRSWHDYGEDETIVASGLRDRGFEVTVTSLEELRSVRKSDYDLIYISNISPDSEEYDDHFFKERIRFYERAEMENLPIYNGLEADKDRLGKTYLINYFDNQMEVIPTIGKIEDFFRLPVSSKYISKPILGFSSRKCIVFYKADLKEEFFKNRIVQPYFDDFLAEISIYVIDGSACYATICPSKFSNSGWDKLTEHNPTTEDVRLALQFSSHIKNGLARIDLIKLNSNQKVLLEIEDNSPYCALPEKSLSEKTKSDAVDALAASLRKKVEFYK